LAVIVANADVIAISGGDTKWTKNIKKEAKKMSELIDDMLTLSKLDSFTNNQTPIQLNISDMLNEMVSEFDPMWKERKIKVDNRVNANLTVTGSQQQVNRLFRTIMQNATKYTTEGGTFELVAKRIKNRIMVSMYNTAQLDPNMDYNKMFERFYRSDSSRNSKTGGHGIGLAIAKKICELEGYQIRAEKQREGIAFIITI
jgi:signal transduction histidine kinase